jgi:hypothetical protein
MTLAAIWKVEEQVYAVADTRISRSPGNVLSEHGPKLLPIGLVCRQPGPSGFFDRPAYSTTFGYAYAGATLPALATHALANTLCQNLAGPSGAEPPTLDEVAGGIREIAERYMREMGALSGASALFSAIVFGFCVRLNRFRAFHIAPVLNAASFRADLNEHDLYGSDTLLVIGNRPELLRDRVRRDRPNLYATPESPNPQYNTMREIDLPTRALRALITEGADETIGGALQTAIVSRAGFQPVAHVVPISPPLDSGRNVALTVLGFDMFEFDHIGSYHFSLTGR